MSQPFMFPSISSIFFSARSIWLWLLFSCFVLFLCWLGGCGGYFFIRRVPDISHTPRIISSLVEIPQYGIQHGYFLEVARACPNLSCFPLFLPSSFQQEALGCDCFFHVLSCFCAGWVVVAAASLFEGVPDISHTPRIISSPVEIPQNGIQHGSFREVAPACPNLSCFPLFLPSSFQQEAFGCDCFFHVLSCFCAGWVVVAATFLFEGFRTSHIPLEWFLPWWKPHRMAFNMALPWKCPQNVPTFHVSLYFFHLLSKKHLVVIAFFMFVLFLGWLGGWLWQLLFYSKGSGHLTYHTPRVFSYVEISHTVGLNANEREGERSVWFGCHCFFIFSGFPFMYPPSLFYILIFPSVSFLGTGLLMSPLAALSPMIWREHWCPYCCEKADRLQRGHRRTGGDVDPIRVRADWLS